MPTSIAELPTLIEWAHQANQPNPFSILVLGDGFTAAEDQTFRQFVATLTDKFLRIPPFTVCKPYINILFVSLPSNNGIPSGTPANLPADWDTTLGVYLDQRRLRIRDTNRVAAVLGHLQMPPDLDVTYGVPRTPAGVWLHPRSKSFGAIGIVANLKTGVGENLFDLSLLDSPGSDPVAESWRFFLFSMSGYEVGPGTFRDVYPHAFAHELGHSLRLFDEYEELTGTIAASSGERFRAYYQNVDFAHNLQPQSLVPSFRWRHLATPDEMAGLESGERVYPKGRLLSLGLVDDYGSLDRNVYTIVPHEQGAPYADRAVKWDDLYLIEGAKVARQMCRTNFECKMRHEVYDARVLPDTTDPRFAAALEQLNRLTHADGTCGAAEFCRVCAHTIRERVTGWCETKLGDSITRLELMQRFYEETMPRVNASFRADIGTDRPELSTDQAVCNIASARAYITLRQCHQTVDARFAFTALHTCLFLNGVFLDPTYYDFFRVSGEMGQPLKWQASDGTLHQFGPEQTTRGMCGDYLELENFFYFFVPRPGSYISRGLSLPAWTQEAVLEVYGKIGLWQGPDRNPEADEIKMWSVGPAVNQTDTDTAEHGLSTYGPTIVHEWEAWQQYLATSSPARMRPLDVRVPITDI